MRSNWEEILKDRLAIFGHRNWIVIADSAYPAQSSHGVETIVAGGEQIVVLDKVFAVLGEYNHIKPTIYTDQELNFVSEEDACGVTSYRERLQQIFRDRDVHAFPHEEIISRLDRTGQMFRVLIIKTDMCIPYTSVFFELECGYWNAQSEARLRAAMRSKDRMRKGFKGRRKS